jgi:hypothetical protein
MNAAAGLSRTGNQAGSAPVRVETAFYRSSQKHVESNIWHWPSSTGMLTNAFDCR